VCLEEASAENIVIDPGHVRHRDVKPANGQPILLLRIVHELAPSGRLIAITAAPFSRGVHATIWRILKARRGVDRLAASGLPSGPMPDGLRVRGNARPALQKPEATGQCRRALPLQETMREIIDEVERMRVPSKRALIPAKQASRRSYADPSEICGDSERLRPRIRDGVPIRSARSGGTGRSRSS
jgi:hypothetical protein